MPGGWELIATTGIVLLAGIVSGTGGFGFALFAVPPLLFMNEPSTVVAMTNVLGVCSGIVVTVTEWHAVRRATLRALIPWAVMGLAIGIAILHVFDELYIKLLASVVVVTFSLHAVSKLPFPGIHRPGAVAAAGLSSGVLGTTTGLTGPPIALLFTARDMEPAAFRVTITTYFVVVNFVAVSLLIVSRQLDRSDMILSLGLVPAALAGRMTGRRIADSISPPVFRHVVLGMLLLTGATGAAGAILTLF